MHMLRIVTMWVVALVCLGMVLQSRAAETRARKICFVADEGRGEALFEDRLARVEDGVGTTLRFDQVADVQATGDEVQGVVVTVTGADGSSVVCSFGPKEGGSRFARQVLTETAPE